MSLNFYTDLIRPTLILENSIRNIHQAFSQNTSNSIRKCLMDLKKFLNFHTEGDQGSLGVFRGPDEEISQPTGSIWGGMCPGCALFPDLKGLIGHQSSSQAVFLASGLPHSSYMVRASKRFWNYILWQHNSKI